MQPLWQMRRKNRSISKCKKEVCVLIRETDFNIFDLDLCFQDRIGNKPPVLSNSDSHCAKYDYPLSKMFEEPLDIFCNIFELHI